MGLSRPLDHLHIIVLKSLLSYEWYMSWYVEIYIGCRPNVQKVYLSQTEDLEQGLCQKVLNFSNEHTKNSKEII